MADNPNKIATPTEDEVARYADGQRASGAVKDSPDGKPTAVEERLASAEAQRDEYKDKMLRAQAECANITKRLTQDRSEAVKLAGMGLARDLVSVMDNFDRTLANLQEAHAEDPVISGVKLVADQLAKVLKGHGVEPIESVGKPFDPVLHEAIMHDGQSDQPAGTITQEFERGYTMHGRVLRHAKVAVAAPPTDGDGQEST